MLDALVMCFDLHVWLRVKNHYRYILTYHLKRIYCSRKKATFYSISAQSGRILGITVAYSDDVASDRFVEQATTKYFYHPSE